MPKNEQLQISRVQTIRRPVDGRLVVNYAYSTVVIVPFSHDFVVHKTLKGCMYVYKSHIHLSSDQNSQSPLGLGNLQKFGPSGIG